MKILLISAVLLLSFVDQLLGQKDSVNTISKIEIVSLSFDAMTRSAIKFENLWEWSDENDVFRTTIIDQNFIEQVTHTIQALQQVSSSSKSVTLDTRIACLLYKFNGATDSISIDRFHIQLNDTIYTMYWPLALLISEYLPANQQIAIKKSMEEQGKMTIEDRERILKESETWHTDD